MAMRLVGQMIKHPEDAAAMVRLKLEMARLKRQAPAEPPHWAFAYAMLHKLSRSFAFVIQLLHPPELRDAVCICYLVLRALDTIEDDCSLSSDVKIPILKSFYRHIFDVDWHFLCGTNDFKVLMDEFHKISKAFSELRVSYQEVIAEITKRMGAGMAEFLCKEVDTVDDYDEYGHTVSGLVGIGLSKLFHASGLEELPPDHLSNSMGLLLHKQSAIRDYLEDISEIPKSRLYWPRQIWSKYANKLEDFKDEEHSTKAVQCLNDMITNALIHVEDNFQYMSTLKNYTILRICAIPQMMAIGYLALYYNNVELFRGNIEMPRGLIARIIEETRTMTDVYNAFFEFSSLIKSKINDNDPNADLTHKRVEIIQKACIDSGLMSARGFNIYRSKPNLKPLIIAVVLLVFILFQLQGTD